MEEPGRFPILCRPSPFPSKQKSISAFRCWFSVAIAVVTALLFGAAPALHSARKDLARGLAGAGKGEGGGFRHGGLRNLLVVAEVALSLILLVGAGALMRSLLSMMKLDLGFNPHNLVVVQPRIPHASPGSQRRGRNNYFTPEATWCYQRDRDHRPSSLRRNPDRMDVPGKTHAEQWRGSV